MTLIARPRDDAGTAVLALAGARENSSAAKEPLTALPAWRSRRSS